MPHDPDKDKSTEQLRREREKRITDAIHLKIPDRVPVISTMGYFPGTYTDTPFSAAWYDYDAWLNAYKKTLPDFQPDMIFAQKFTPGKAMEMLNPNSMKWPGFGVNPNYGHQSIEHEYMKAEDYDAFLQDHTQYLLSNFLSRTGKNMTGFTEFPGVADFHSSIIMNTLALAFSSPEFCKSIDILQQAGNEIRKWQPKMKDFDDMLLDMGFPVMYQMIAMPPFDVISNGLRGMTGFMKDIFRQPEKVSAACEKILDITLARPMGQPNDNGNIRIFMTNTRGSDDFLSNKHFEQFYWPTFKKLVTTLVERGGTPCIFFEGNFTSKLKYLLEFPKGKILAKFDTTDIFRAKEILKDHMCIEGNVPSSLLQVGSVQEVKDYCKKLIDIVGKDGGYILAPRSSVDKVKPENLKAMIDFTKEYGVY